MSKIGLAIIAFFLFGMAIDAIDHIKYSKGWKQYYWILATTLEVIGGVWLILHMVGFIPSPMILFGG